MDPVQRIVGTEELILRLTPRLAWLNESVQNLQLPDYRARSLFQDRVDVRDLRHEPATSIATEANEVENAQLRFWEPLLREVSYFDSAKFAIVDGRFLGDLRHFLTDISFRGRARMREGQWADICADLEVEWRQDGEDSDSAEAWAISRWTMARISASTTDSLFYVDRSADAIPNQETRRRLQESKHWEYATRHYYRQRRASLPGGLSDDRFFPISTAHHPSAAVVDIDNDGFDDLYITVRWGKNLLLRNRGDSTFEEVADHYGLDLEGRSNAAVFVDFDNDGDKDLMLARSLERSAYLVNEGGQFIERSSWVQCDLPYEATSVCAADVNGDGLIDVYFSTYHQDDVSRRIDADLAHPEHRIHRYLSADQSAELRRRFKSENRSFVNQIGPPNLLLLNLGDGQFGKAANADELSVWRNSFQASWSDYDQDGDVDLYVANDFAPDHLFRNDGAEGWNDVSHEVGINPLGFGMGVSWGDYDNDGQDDLYVSNMYSKAGSRITRRVEGLDPRISLLASGNYLFRQEANQFRLVSGLTPPAMLVARAGWAWGGQFLDFDNDGFLDIYVASGYYTAPSAFETSVDL